MLGKTLIEKWLYLWEVKKVFILLFLTLALFALGENVSAEITNPYTVDEKAQVIFGDSVIISATSTYQGLENYVASYVDNYLHITFTYTHSRFSFASYPPRLYITANDPRSTTTPGVRDQQVVYQLGPIPVPPGHETDWYAYDVQFDATGYTVIVKQGGTTEIINEHRNIGGLINSDWAALANLFPMQNPSVSFSMSFTPLSIRDNVAPPEQALPDPVIIVPGIMGSAYKNGVLVIDPILHTYDDLIATLDANGYEIGKDLFTFPYEWRDSNVFSANLLDAKISEVKAVCQCSKVDLVAHSMGGLVARAYIQSGSYDGDVDQLIFLGTPHKGSPKAYLEWEAGEFEPSTLNFLTREFFKIEARRNGYDSLFNYIHNRPILSVQELLPVTNYLKDKNTGVIRTYPDNYPRNNFLEVLNNNVSNLFGSGVRITNIIGSTNSSTTINIIRVENSYDPLWVNGKPDGFDGQNTDIGLEKGSGDETVTISGATLNSSIPNQEVSSAHQRIPTAAEAKIFNILTGKTASTTYDNGTGLDIKILLLQLLSPIDVVITAPDGKKIGKNFASGAEYNEIAGAFYSGYQTDNEYIVILNPLDGEYKVEVQGTGTGGNYGVLTSYVSEEFSTTTEVVGITAPNQITNLSVGIDNENSQILEPEREVTLDMVIADIKGAYDIEWITDRRVRDRLVTYIKHIIRFHKDKHGKWEKRVDRILIKLSERELDLFFKKGTINKQAYDLIKKDLEYLKNNN